jgi:hypothetical protein
MSSILIGGGPPLGPMCALRFSLVLNVNGQRPIFFVLKLDDTVRPALEFSSTRKNVAHLKSRFAKIGYIRGFLF